MGYENSGNQMRIGVIALGIFIFAWGLIWMGNDLKWWSINFPFWPVIVVIIGLVILLTEIRKSFQK